MGLRHAELFLCVINEGLVVLEEDLQFRVPFEESLRGCAIVQPRVVIVRRRKGTLTERPPQGEDGEHVHTVRP